MYKPDLSAQLKINQLFYVHLSTSLKCTTKVKTASWIFWSAPNIASKQKSVHFSDCFFRRSQIHVHLSVLFSFVSALPCPALPWAGLRLVFFIFYNFSLVFYFFHEVAFIFCMVHLFSILSTNFLYFDPNFLYWALIFYIITDFL